MLRRRFLQSGAAYLAGTTPEDRPNLLLMADQHRGDSIGASGNAAIHTPNLDRLAGEEQFFNLEKDPHELNHLASDAELPM